MFSDLFTAAFLILVAASAAVTGSMILLGLIDRIFRKKAPPPAIAAPEDEELEEWTEELWSKDAAHDERIRTLLGGPEIEPLGGR